MKKGILSIGGLGLPVSRDLYYAGTERIISYLDDEFVKKGHYSIVAAPGDSEVSGELFATIPQSLWRAKNGSGERDILRGDEIYAEHYDKVINYVISNQNRIDIVHDHSGNGLVNSDGFWNRRDKWPSHIPILTTHHANTGIGFDENKYKRWRKLKKEGHLVFFNGISYSQKEEFERNTGIGLDEVIYHGVPLQLFPFNENPHDYLFSLGRICGEKGQDYAIQVARKTGRPLILGGEVHSVDEDYFSEKVKLHLDFSIRNLDKNEAKKFKSNFLERLASGEDVMKDGRVKFIGGLTDKEKALIYGNAFAYLMPITWSEPFGLVMIESMATGTPVVGFDYGSVPEVIDHGRSGYIIPKISLNGDLEITGRKNLNEEAMIEEMVKAVENVGKISRTETRKRVENNFTSELEAINYLSLYGILTNNGLSR